MKYSLKTVYQKNVTTLCQRNMHAHTVDTLPVDIPNTHNNSMPVKKQKGTHVYAVPPVLRNTSSLPARYYTAEADDVQDHSDIEDLMFDIDVNDDEVSSSVKKAATDPIKKELPLSNKMEWMIILMKQRAAAREAKKTIIGISPETKITNGFTTKSSSSYVDSLKSEETDKEEYMCLK